jgi:predicted outer membrane protein
VIRPTLKLHSGRLLAVAAVAGLLVAAPARAEDAAAPPPADKKICTREQRTGSKIPVKVCRTQAEIDAERQATQNAMKGNPSANYKRGT